MNSGSTESEKGSIALGTRPPAQRRRLDQILSSQGLCSRSRARLFLRNHEVTAGGVALTDPSVRVLAGELSIDRATLEFPDGLLVRLNKPAGYICSHDSGEGRTIYSLLPQHWMLRQPKPVSVGRLDKDTTGIILITDIPQLVHDLTSPRRHVAKTYLVTVDTPIPPATIGRFSSGELLLNGEKTPCLPAQLTVTAPCQAEVVLHEGRYHQVKRMFAACGLKVIALHRSSFGPYTLNGLAEGQFQPICP